MKAGESATKLYKGGGFLSQWHNPLSNITNSALLLGTVKQQFPRKHLLIKSKWCVYIPPLTLQQLDLSKLRDHVWMVMFWLSKQNSSLVLCFIKAATLVQSLGWAKDANICHTVSDYTFVFIVWPSVLAFTRGCSPSWGGAFTRRGISPWEELLPWGPITSNMGGAFTVGDLNPGGTLTMTASTMGLSQWGMHCTYSTCSLNDVPVQQKATNSKLSFALHSLRDKFSSLSPPEMWDLQQRSLSSFSCKKIFSTSTQHL